MTIRPVQSGALPMIRSSEHTALQPPPISTVEIETRIGNHLDELLELPRQDGFGDVQHDVGFGATLREKPRENRAIALELGQLG